MNKVTRNRLFFLLKIIVTSVILYYLFRKIDLTIVFRNFLCIRIDILLLLVTTAIYKLYLQYRNWQEFLSINPEYASNSSEIFRSLLAGYALRFLIPGGYGIVGKVYFVKNKKQATLVSVGLEKFIQIWTSLLFASISAIFFFKGIQLYLRLLIFLLILISPFILILISSLIRHNTIRSYLSNYRKSASILAFRQIQFFVLTILQFFIVLRNFVEIAILTVFITIPLILSANLIPFSYAGLGFKEAFAVGILDRYNISPEIAITSTLMVFFINTALPALAGVFMILKRKVSAEE